VNPWALVLLIVWAFLLVGFFWTVIRLQEKRVQALHARAYDEILREKGITRRPEETRKQALLRAYREESLRPFQTAVAKREAERLNRSLRTPYQAFSPAGAPRPKQPSRHDR